MRREIRWTQDVHEIPTLKMQYKLVLEHAPEGRISVQFYINDVTQPLGPRQTVQLLAGLLMLSTTFVESIDPEDHEKTEPGEQESPGEN